MELRLQYKNREHVFVERERGGVSYLECPMLSGSGFVKHGFSTRLGGVSEGIFSSMNFSFTRGDDSEAVRENYRRMAKTLGIREDGFVCSMQTHTTNVRVVTEEDRGKGVVRERDYEDVDGLVTNVPGLCLTTFYADCVPLFFVDPTHRAIGLSHSGWRGTVGRMGKVTLETMREAYGTQPEDVLAAVGPSICQECYEVSVDVVDAFREQFDKKHWEQLFYPKKNGKYQLDLWKANEIVLQEAGVRKEHMAVTNLCTCCNPKYLFSHRASAGKRGNLAAFLAICEEDIENG